MSQLSFKKSAQYRGAVAGRQAVFLGFTIYDFRFTRGILTADDAEYADGATKEGGGWRIENGRNADG